MQHAERNFAHERVESTSSDDSVSNVNTPLLSSEGAQSAFRVPSTASSRRPEHVRIRARSEKSISNYAPTTTASNVFSGSLRYVEREVIFTGPPDFKPWTPRIFHWIVFLALVLVTTAIIVLSELFIHLAEPGLAPVPGAVACVPVILLIVLAASWHSLDLEVRKLTPWALMRGELASASTTVGLDYLGPFLPVRFFRAVRARDWAVAISTFGVLLLATSTIISTSVWTVRPATTFLPTDLTTAAAFDTSRLDAASVNQSYLNQYLDHISNPNTPFPPSTTAEFVVEPLAASSTLPAHTLLRGATRALSGGLSCEGATVTYAGNVSATDPTNSGRNGVVQHRLTATTAACSATYDFLITSGDAVNTAVPFGYALRHSCTGSPDVTLLVHGQLINASLNPVTSLACKATYTETTVTVTADSSSGVLSYITPLGAGAPLTVTSGSALISTLDGSLAATTPGYWTRVPGATPAQDAHYWRRRDPFAESAFASAVPFDNGQTYPGDFGPWFHLQAHALDLAPSAAQEGAQTLFSQAFPFFAGANLLAPSVPPARAVPGGEAQVVAPRLFARAGVLRGVEALLGVSLLLLPALFVLRPRPQLPRDPASLGFLLGLMQASPDAREAMRYTSTLDERVMRRCMVGWHFGTGRTAGGKIGLRAEWDPTETYHVVSENASAEVRFWRPLMLLPPAIALLLLGILACFAALQATLAASPYRGGLDSNVWTYVSALLGVALAAALVRFVFALATVEQFLLMRQDPQPSSRALGHFAFVDSPVTALWRGITSHCWAVALGGASLVLMAALLLLNAALFVEVVDGAEEHVAQNEAVTRVMQALLGALFACVIAGVALVRGADQALLKPPYSVAAQMSLLEGCGALEDRMRSPMEDTPTRRVLEPEERLEGYWFRLGWADGEGMRRYGVDIVPRP